MGKLLYIPFAALCLIGCHGPQRDCQTFKNGTFTFTATVDGEELTTTFVRQGDIEVDYFGPVPDTSSVRWINDCEYVVRKLRPKNRAEEKSIHIKILSTSEDAYTFEYGIVGESIKTQGKALKTE